ncbi:MAG: DNA polymerase-3 subunit gamma/tau [Parvicellaceae bacterium]|jgi:DNA polymerase-3 subunit gamma/tau
MLKWNNYANRMKNNGKTNLHATLTKHKPELKPDFVIELSIDNTVQEEVLALEKMEFLDYLRNELNNFQIQLKTVLVKTESGNALYTTRDKFEKLAEKNPSLNKLKDLLNLDLDY